jgi:hypothetical protein
MVMVSWQLCRLTELIDELLRRQKGLRHPMIKKNCSLSVALSLCHIHAMKNDSFRVPHGFWFLLNFDSVCSRRQKMATHSLKSPPVPQPAVNVCFNPGSLNVFEISNDF